MSSSKRKIRWWPKILMVPAVFGIGASLWPLESILLFLICGVFTSAVLLPVLMVRTIRHWFIGITSLAILISIMTTNWPLHAAWRLSRGSFQATANEIRRGEMPNTPCWVGLFRIEKAEISPAGVICLWTDDRPSGATGFVEFGPHDLPFNLWSHHRLDHEWQFISED